MQHFIADWIYVLRRWALGGGSDKKKRIMRPERSILWLAFKSLSDSLKQEKSEHGFTQKSWVAFPTLQNLTFVFSTLALEFKLNYSTNKRKYFNFLRGEILVWEKNKTYFYLFQKIIFLTNKTSAIWLITHLFI